MRRILIWLSGASWDILARYPTDRAKYEGIGGAVLTTAAIAAVSCGFALRMALRSPLVACVAIALGWGLAIMSLDRWLVASIQRHEDWRGNLLVALPRLGLAILIGAVISTPLVLRVFQPEIDTKIAELRQERTDQFYQEIRNGERADRIRTLQTAAEQLERTIDNEGSPVDPGADPEVTRLRQWREQLQRKIDTAREQLACEFTTTCGSRRPGDGPIAAERRAKLREAEAQIRQVEVQLAAREGEVARRGSITQANNVQRARAQLPGVQGELTELRRQQDAAVSDFEAKNGRSGGLLGRLDALGRLTGENGTLRAAHLLLFLFITALECLPVLVKFLQSLGPRTAYERAVEIQEKSRLVVEQKRANAWSAAEILNADDEELEARAGREARDEMIDQIAHATARARADIAEAVVTAWRDRELQRVRDDPEQFMTPESPRPGGLNGEGVSWARNPGPRVRSPEPPGGGWYRATWDEDPADHGPRLIQPDE